MTQQFGDFTATELYCPKCKVAQPVREKLLLLLPSGELYQYLCTLCGTSLGERTITGKKPVEPKPQRRSRPPFGLLQ